MKSFLRPFFEQHASRVLIREKSGILRYGQIWEKAEQKSREWKTQIGDKKGCIVLRHPNSSKMLVEILAGWMLDQNVAPISVRMPEIQARRKILALQPSLISTVKGITITRNHDVINNDCAVTLMTSGSSGEGDRINLLSSNLIANLDQIDKVVSRAMIHSEDESFSILPWSHCYGLVCELLFMIRRGASIHIPPSLSNLSRDLYAAQPTILFAVPVLIERILQKLRFTQHPYYEFARPIATPLLRKMILGGRLRAISIGGARSAPGSLELFKETLGVSCFEGYGMTECSPMISLQTDQHYKIGSVGKILPDMDVQIDPSNGEILVAGPNVCQGLDPSRYIIMENNKKYLKTGDSGCLDKENFLWIADRLGEHFKLSNGLFVHPRRVEMLYDQFRPIHISHWVILPDQKNVNVLMIGIMNTDHAHSNILEISDLERIGKTGGLPKHEIPRSIYYMSKKEAEPFLTEKQTPRRGLLARYMSIHG